MFKNKLLTVRILALVLVSVMALVTLMACIGNTPEETSPDTPEATPEETVPEEIKETLELIKSGKCGYTIIRPELAAEDLMVHIRAFRSKMNDLTGDLVKLAEDWLNPIKNEQPGEFEILLGNTNREETQKVLSEIKYSDWKIDIVNKKLVIVGHTDEATAEAIDYFVENFLDPAGDSKIDTLNFAPENIYWNKAEYELDDITLNGVSVRKYSVVYSAKAADDVVENANKLAEFISLATGYKVSAVKDNGEASEYEILVGGCDRDESTSTVENLKNLDYVISLKGTRLVVAGGANKGTVNACAELMNYITETGGTKTIAISSGDVKNYVHGEYLVGTVMIGANNIKEYRIVYESGNKLAKLGAEMLLAVIQNNVGVTLPLVSDTTPVGSGCEILLGFTNRTDEGGVAEALLSGYDHKSGAGFAASNEKYIVVCGNRDFSIALGRFMTTITPSEKTERLDVDLSNVNSLESAFEKVKVMSFNILTGASGSRFKEIQSIINYYSPDVIGFQEVQPATMKALQSVYGDKYGYVILERDNSSKEATPLFYDKTKYDLVESGSGWLSDTPDKMSKYPESDYHRVYVYVILQNKETGTKFVHVNTHIDYVGAATTKQVQVLLDLTKKFSDLPMFYTADWNMYTSSPGYSLMTNAGYLDASTMTDNAHTGPTMVGGSAPIDFCFTSATQTYVGRYEVVDDHQYSDTASDHYAIYTEIYVAPIK